MTEGLHRFYGGKDLHFLTFSCYRRRPLFRNEAHCDLFLKILNRVRGRYRFVVLGYVVMPEHVHLLVSEPQRETLSTAIQALKLGVVRSMRCSSASVVAAAPRSRKIGETWGTCDLSRRCTRRNSSADGRSVTEATMGTVEVVML